MQIISRKLALMGGLSHYFTGLPCKHGHYALRYVQTRQCIDCARETKARWAKNNRPKMNAWRDAWGKRNPERALFWGTKWMRDNPDLRREVSSRCTSKRRAQKLGSGGSHTQEEWNKIVELQDRRCAYCRARFSKKTPPTKDHILALSRGGTDDACNLQATCLSCNSRKHARDAIDFSQSLGLLI